MVRRSDDKVMTMEALAERLETHRSAGERIVFTNGCFDIIHAGHVTYLEQARELGDVLVIGVNSDASVQRNKGPNRPIIGERDRLKLLAALESVDYVTLFDDDTPLETIKRVRPDVLVKGEEWVRKGGVVGQEFVESTGGRVVLASMVPGISTTDVINRVKERCSEPEQGV